MKEILLHDLPYYVLLFAAFSIAGWVMEVVLKFIQLHRFVNRGYLIGPYCPIYGWGALLVTLLAGGVFYRRCTPVEAFLVGFFACGSLEYAVSWVLERTSHARWWDYSQKPMNLNGRVWIGNLLLFGAAAVFIVYAAVPFLFGVFAAMPALARQIAAGAFLVVLWSDRVVSHLLVRQVRDSIEHQTADNTEEIRREMNRLLQSKSLLRRISAAYPALQPRPRRLVELLQSARAEYRDAAKRARTQLRALERAGRAKRGQATQKLTESLRLGLTQAQTLKQQAREKLREIERDVFNNEP